MLPRYCVEENANTDLKLMFKKTNQQASSSVLHKQLLSLISNKTKTIKGLVSNWNGKKIDSTLKLNKEYWRIIKYSEDPSYRVRRVVGMNRSQLIHSPSLPKPITVKANMLPRRDKSKLNQSWQGLSWKDQAKIFCSKKVFFNTKQPLLRSLESFCTMKSIVLPNIKEKYEPSRTIDMWNKEVESINIKMH